MSSGGPIFLAVDLGASSGRVMAGRWDGATFSLDEIHRFPNSPTHRSGRLETDAAGLWREVQRGLGVFAARGEGPPAGIGVDSWGVDFGLLDEAGALIEPPVHYRDGRTAGEMDRVFRRVPKGEIFRTTGIQFMPINTLFQLSAAVRLGDAALARAHTMLLTPDLFHYWLSGERVAEYTIASTGQMLDAAARGWATGLLDQLGLPTRILPPLVPPGTVLAPLQGALMDRLGWHIPVPVVAPGAHDTASAVAAVPDLDDRSAYLSSGTWSLLGVETREPVINDLSFVMNFTNEGGVGGTIRLLKNVMGLWLVQECVRAWERDGKTRPLKGLLAAAEAAPAFVSLVDPDAPEFLAPGDMPAAIRNVCRRTGQPEPATEGAFMRCCLESLALKYRVVLGDLERLTGRRLEAIRVVGGGSQNSLLNRFTAAACGRPVVAGPVEATALGNIAVQAVATGILPNLAAARRALGAAGGRETFVPGEAGPWDDASRRFREVMGS